MESFPATSPYRLLCLLILHSKPRKELSSSCFFGVSLGRVLFRFKSGLKIQEFVLTYLGETWRVYADCLWILYWKIPFSISKKTRTRRKHTNLKAMSTCGAGCSCTGASETVVDGIQGRGGGQSKGHTLGRKCVELHLIRCPGRLITIGFEFFEPRVALSSYACLLSVARVCAGRFVLVSCVCLC